jgi:tetratricopeptide (TPR) repeat protein
MYLRGSKWNMTRRTRKPSNPLFLLLLIAAIGGLYYIGRVYLPKVSVNVPFISTPTATRSPESFLNEAEALTAEGKISQAVEAYEQAIISDPTNPATYISLARVQLLAGLYQEALKNADNALLLNPNNAMALTVKAWALNYMEDYLGAEATIAQALELDANNALAYAVNAEILLDQGNYEDIETAIAMSRKAQELAPNALETHRIRGYVLFYTANYEDALAEYQAAIALNDKLWDLHYSLGAIYKAIGEYDLAVQEMLAAVALNPTNPDILTEISRTYAAVGQFGKAIQYAEQALSLDPSSPRLHGNLGVMLYKSDEYSRAADELALAVQGGMTADGTPVQGLPLAPGRIADDYYSIYALSLTNLDRCAQAVPIMQLILSNIADDQVAYYNAVQGMEYCRQAVVTATPTTEAAP